MRKKNFASLKSLKKRIGLELDPDPKLDPDPDPLVRGIDPDSDPSITKQI